MKKRDNDAGLAGAGAGAELELGACALGARLLELGADMQLCNSAGHTVVDVARH